MAKLAVTIIDHRINNLESILHAFRYLDVEVAVARHPEDIRDCGHILLPGVGAFGASMKELDRTGLGDAIVEHIRVGNPMMGICLGYQALFTTGTEGATRKALGVIPGRVERLEGDLPLPHVGWNQVQFTQDHPVLDHIPNGTHMYFVHSFRPVDVPEENILGRTQYGAYFVSAIAKQNVVGTQFHPELSGADGLRLLLGFANWRP